MGVFGVVGQRGEQHGAFPALRAHPQHGDPVPVPLEGLSFLGGEASRVCFEEVKRCYLDGSDIAVVLLCLAYVERELAAGLYAAGWEDAKEARARLGTVLERAYGYGALSDLELRTYRELARLRNSHAHFRAPGDKTPGGSPLDGQSLMARAVHGNLLGTEVLAKDARRAIQALARIVKRQSGMRVALGPPDE